MTITSQDLAQRLTARHLDDLRQSGLSDETIWENGLFSASKLTPQNSIEGLNRVFQRPPDRPFTSDALLFPYDYEPSFTSTFLRAKPDTPIPDEHGNEARYVTKTGAGNRLYIPRRARPSLRDPSVRLILTEGEKKSLAATQNGFPCVALAGVSCWVEKPRDQQGRKLTHLPSQPIRDLDLITQAGAERIICYDSDYMVKREVEGELYKLAAELYKRRMTPYALYLPQLDGQAKTGLDDYLVARGADRFRTLLEAARPITLSTITPTTDDLPVVTLAPYPVIAPDAFYGLAKDLIDAIAPHTEADPVALLVQLLIGFGNLIGRGPHVLAEADPHYTNEFVVLVGQSSRARKGTAWGHTFSLLAALDDVWAKTRIAHGLTSGEGLIWHVRDTTDTQHDAGVTDKRLLIYESEFAATLRVMGREGSTLSSTIRQAWDGRTLQTLAKNSPARASTPHISLIGHITPEEVRAELHSMDRANGFGNRILWVCVRRSQLLPDGGTVDPATLNQFLPRLHQAVDAARHYGHRPIPRTEGARQVWHELYPDLTAEQPGLLGAITARAEAHTMRLATLYALLDATPERPPVIDVPHVLAARLLWDYCDQSARYIFGQSTGNRTADRILEALRQHPEGMTQDDLVNLFARNKSREEIAEALGVLERQGLARRVAIPTRGRPKTIWMTTQDET